MSKRADEGQSPSAVRTLVAELQGFLTPQSAIVGVGSEERGDDGFGPAVVRGLESRSGMVLVDAGAYPENHLGPIVSRRPASVLIVDAADLARPTGTLMVCEAKDLAPGGISCHAGSLALLAGYIEQATSAKCRLLLVQPESVPAWRGEALQSAGDADTSAGLSAPVRLAVEHACEAILAVEKAYS
jgi:hydrogenase maturation protease